MQLEELVVQDPGQDGPAWLWVGPGFPPEAAERIRQDYARKMLDLQKRYCLSGDEVHALSAATWAVLHHAMTPPWVEAVIGRAAWATFLAPTVIQGRRYRQTHWIRYAAVRDRLRWQRDAGKRQNVTQACEAVSKALRGRPGRGTRRQVEASFRKVDAACQRGEVNRYLLGPIDRRYRSDVL
jgi:hypothetical protein